MHADTFRPGPDHEDTAMPVLMALALHAGLVLLLVIAGWWNPAPQVISVAGPVVEAALVVSPSDVVAAEQSAAAAPKPTPPPPVEAAPPPQPLPAPRPQDAPVEPQPAPQERVPEPSPIDQEAVARLALEQEQAREREIQEAKRRQEQIDLTERQRLQEEAEQRQRLREQQLAQLAELRRQREEAERRTRMEEQRLRQLADRDAAPAPSPAPAQPAGGNNGVDTDLAAKYALAMLQTAEMNWNRSLAPERTPCRVSFTQIPGGEVIDVRFLACGFDDQARESVERALRRSPMPYAGFEPVFKRQIELTFCYPQEACPR